jgi:hypothetical protein
MCGPLTIFFRAALAVAVLLTSQEATQCHDFLEGAFGVSWHADFDMCRATRITECSLFRGLFEDHLPSAVLHLREAPQIDAWGGGDERRHDLRPCPALLRLEAHDAELLCSRRAGTTSTTSHIRMALTDRALLCIIPLLSCPA